MLFFAVIYDIGIFRGKTGGISIGVFFVLLKEAIVAQEPHMDRGIVPPGPFEIVDMKRTGAAIFPVHCFVIRVWAVLVVKEAKVHTNKVIRR